MDNWGYYTPDGVSDYLPDLCASKRALEERLRKLFLASGFRELETSGLEFYDAYTYQRNFAKQEELFKVTDERGRLLALRFDGTIPVARLAATILKNEPRPLRLSYIGRMYRFGEHGGGKMKEFTQAGVELLGSGSSAADAEVIALALDSLQKVGLEAIQISIGQIEFFRSLAVSWQMEVEAIEALSKLLDERNEVAAWALLNAYDLTPEDREIIRLLLTASGDWDLLEELRRLCHDAKALDVLDELTALATLLDEWELLSFCSLDLAELSGMNYYTGLIFRAYSYGIGFPLCSGGRYDDVVSSFGLPTAATGFSLGVDLCLQALSRQGRLEQIDLPLKRIVVPRAARHLALPLAKKMRGEGELLELYWLENEDETSRASELAVTLSAGNLSRVRETYLLQEDGSLTIVQTEERTEIR